MQSIKFTDAKFEPLSMAFAPDGRLLAVWGWGQVCVIDTAAGAVRGGYGEKDVGMTELPGVGFTADGRGVIVYDDSKEPFVRVYDLDSGKVLRECPNDHGKTMEVGPGGRLVYLTHRPKPYWTE